jgi:menaquinone reductase, multiheme cytochrome c subunit
MPVPAFFLENGLDGGKMKMHRNMIFFTLGVVTALFVGWFVFPRVLYVKKSQPLDFLHKTHADKSGLSDCSECHTIREDGTFAGLPSTEKCAGCHSDRLGESKAEALLVNDFVKPGQETSWLVYSQQPANVWFSHAIHVKRAKLACSECHSSYGESDEVRIYEVNRITGYSRDIWGHSISRLRRAPHDGMKMSDCEACHERHHVETGCLGCHQ